MFNNPIITRTIQVIKKVDGTQVAGWTVNASSPSAPMAVTPASVVTVASRSGERRVGKVWAAGSSVHLVKGHQTGYTAGAVSCVAPSLSAQPGSAGTVDVTVQPEETCN